MLDRVRPPLPYDVLPAVPSFTVTSTDITDGATLPDAHVYAGGNRSPQLSWSGFPAGTKSFAVTCYDPDAPTGSGFWHWLLFDIAPTVTALSTGAGTADGSGLPIGAMSSVMDFGGTGYGGAAPPPGDWEHRYVFAVHALDVDSLAAAGGLTANTPAGQVGFNLTFHTLARGMIVATYAAPAE